MPIKTKELPVISQYKELIQACKNAQNAWQQKADTSITNPVNANAFTCCANTYKKAADCINKLAKTIKKLGNAPLSNEQENLVLETYKFACIQYVYAQNLAIYTLKLYEYDVVLASYIIPIEHAYQKSDFLFNQYSANYNLKMFDFILSK
jgi:hypothetical protein